MLREVKRLDVSKTRGRVYYRLRNLLDGPKFHVFVPIADPGLVGVAGAALELLRGVLHLVDKLVWSLCLEVGLLPFQKMNKLLFIYCRGTDELQPL